MSTTIPKLEAVTLAIVAAITGLNTFPTIQRGRIIGQSITTDALPACGVCAVADRVVIDPRNPKGTNREIDVVEFEFALQINAKSQSNPAIDQELLVLRQKVKDLLNLNTLGGLVSEIQYRGTDRAIFISIPEGSEVIGFRCRFVEAKNNSTVTIA